MLSLHPGRGANLNSHAGNQKFRALCFSRKHECDSANAVTKRRIATEIVDFTMATYGSRFFKKMRSTKDKGEDTSTWTRMTREQAILKASQVMRDYKRPDRVAERARTGRKRNVSCMTPVSDALFVCQGLNISYSPRASRQMEDVPTFPTHQARADIDDGVHEHDVLSGRGAVSYLPKRIQWLVCVLMLHSYTLLLILFSSLGWT